MKLGTKLILAGILFLSLLLHFFRINIPNHTVFDETHYATYAFNYVTKTPFFDVHPPLGKFIYSLPLYFASKTSLGSAPFIEIVKSGVSFSYFVKNREFHTFPYIPLRIISSLFGVLLIFSVFLFIRELSKNDTLALLCAFLLTLDNALLIETKFIYLESIFLSFCFLSLWQFIKKNDSGIHSGILWGFALATKLVGIIFLPFVLFQKSGFWKNYKFITVGFVTLGVLWVGIQFSSFSLNSWISFFAPFNNEISSIKQNLPSSLTPTQAISLKSYLFLTELSWSTEGYTTTSATNPAQSKWYQWPFMLGSFCYNEYKNPFCLMGNPALWALAIIALIITLIHSCLSFINKTKIDHTLKMLSLGYVSTLLPFALIPRYMIMWQYFSAFIFSVCLVAYWTVRLSSPLEKKYQILSYLILAFIVVLGFLIISPVTFGYR